MNDRHPEELLAAYVDGELNAADRRAVEAHAASCAVCTEELALARRAVAALGALDDVPAPAGLATPAIQRAKPEARWVRRLGWAAAGTAAAAVIALFAVTQLGGGTAADLGPQSGRDVAEQAGGPEGDAAGAPVAGPMFLDSTADYSSEEVSELVRRSQKDEDVVLSGADGGSTHSLDSPQGRAAVECIDRAGLRGDETTTLLRIEAARFEGTPAYIVLFRRGDEAFEVWVVDRQTCGILHVASSS
jgi:hypothetical protein